MQLLIWYSAVPAPVHGEALEVVDTKHSLGSHGKLLYSVRVGGYSSKNGTGSRTTHPVAVPQCRVGRGWSPFATPFGP